MNLQALYDLKERLEYAAIAGTGLMHEDFRLHRAVEALAPLAGVNPVFAKISAAARALLNAPREERSTRLMDVLSLVEAVVYTQGVSNVSGDLVVMVPGMSTYVEVSYGELQPLLTALGSSGSGRLALIQKYSDEHMAYFSDFRVLPHVVKALGDNYAEVTELIEAILVKQGQSIIPMLKNGFDPSGKMEMTRRVRLIAKLAGEMENDWFVSILPDSIKNVREAVIQALSLSQDNGQLLMDICQSERGKLKEAALRSLAMMEDQACADFLRKEIGKKPENVGFLKGVRSVIAADLTVEALNRFLETLCEEKRYTSKQLDTLVTLTDAVCGKYSPQVRTFWQQISKSMNILARIKPDERVYSGALSVAEHLQRCMMLSVLSNPCSEMIGLVRDLAKSNRTWFLCCAFLADLMVQEPECVFDQFGQFLIPDGRADEKAGTQLKILKVFATCRWEKRGFLLEYRDFDTITGTAVKMQRPIARLDSRWAMYLTNTQNQKTVPVYDLASMHYPRKLDMTTDQLLMKMIDPENPHLCEILGQYFSQKERLSGEIYDYMDALIHCGWKDWRGMIVRTVRRENQVRYYWLMETLNKLPMTNGQKAAELREINELVENGSVSVWTRVWPAEQIEMMIAQMESNPDLITNQGGN